MNPHLAALLKAYEDFQEAAPEKADNLADVYEKRLQEYSEQSCIG